MIRVLPEQKIVLLENEALRVALDCDIYITGSNAKLLSGELATYLGGRYVEFVIYPFSSGASCSRSVPMAESTQARHSPAQTSPTPRTRRWKWRPSCWKTANCA